jgi:hypothetical protein
VVNPLKAPVTRPVDPQRERLDPRNNKHPFKDFRDLLKSGSATEGTPGGGRPLDPKPSGLEGLEPGTPLAMAEPRPVLGQPSGPSEQPLLLADDVTLEPVIDPLELVLTAPLPAPPAAVSELTPRTDYAAAVEELVRRISWGGDRRSGSARIELGGGRFEGGSVVVHAFGRQVQLELELPPGCDGGALESRLRERLAARGIDVADVSRR